MNGRAGVVCGAISADTARWTVLIDEDSKNPASYGAFRASNLQVVQPHDAGTQWADEDGRVWPKAVDFARQCAKGHALTPLADCGGAGCGLQLMCRMCHSLCASGCDAASNWLMCSAVVGCCGGYAVCDACARAPKAAAAASASLDTCPTLVTDFESAPRPPPSSPSPPSPP